ncbi:MAG: glycoside hydrolase family 127 protein [Treponema sp.]|jgi:DUF1680 family protein|nr:glycoside hydrolase family 127 protein [Treponema sp.]
MKNTLISEFLPLNTVSINDRFWSPFMERIRTKVIPYQWEALNDRIPGAEPSYCMRNFKLAAELTHPELNYGVPKDTGHAGFVFQDSDVAKWIEAASYSLVWHPDPKLEQTVDGAVDIICNAQQDDGYLDTFYIINGMNKRFTNLKDNHELYCFGHFLEAAVAYYEATGKRKLLDALIRYTECIDNHIGPEDGKLHGYPGHEIAEMALARLYHITKDEKHIKLATYFINERGKSPLYFEEETKRNGNDFYWKDSYMQYQYYQAGKPVREQFAAEGHAVRGVYLYSGMADVARLTGDRTLLEVCEVLFANIATKQMYITGAIGQSAYGEAFSYDYNLPNDTIYGETCAAIGLAFFARRMLEFAPRNIYADVLEKTLYNGIISGISLDGTAYFYVNPLEVFPEAAAKDNRMRHVKIERQKWFGCACCPPNIARIISSLGTYIHSLNTDSLYTHLYMGNEAQFTIGGKELFLKTETLYPWEGRVDSTFTAPSGAAFFTYGLRIPGWCQGYTLELNGEKITPEVQNGYAVIKREWKSRDRITIIFDMPVVFVETSPHVRETRGKAAVMRGPLVYCLEEADNGKELCRLHLGTPKGYSVLHEQDVLEGVTVISFVGKREKDWTNNALYRIMETSVLEDKPLRFIPYYAWANRGPGEMTLWVNK